MEAPVSFCPRTLTLPERAPSVGVVRSHSGLRRLAATTFLAAVCGCSSSPPAEPPHPSSAPDEGLVRVVEGAGDSVSAIPGSAGALYRYRFRQVDPPSDGFTFQDRDLSFFMKPTPDALHIQVENRQDRPVWIDWDKSVFYDPDGRQGKLAHSTTRWDDRSGISGSRSTTAATCGAATACPKRSTSGCRGRRS